MAADLVQRDQAVVAVESGVLDALGHHRRGELLEAHGEIEHFAPALPGLGRGFQREHAAHEVEHARIGDAGGALCAFDRRVATGLPSSQRRHSR